MDEKKIPVDKAMDMLFLKVGQLTFQMDLMQMQLKELSEENARLTAILDAQTEQPEKRVHGDIR